MVSTPATLLLGRVSVLLVPQRRANKALAGGGSQELGSGVK